MVLQNPVLLEFLSFQFLGSVVLYLNFCNKSPPFVFFLMIIRNKKIKQFAQALSLSWASLIAQMVKHLSVMRETRVRSLGWEDPLEKEMATHSRIHAWKVPWTEEPGGLQSMGSQRVRHDWVTSLFTSNKLTAVMH